MCFCYLFHKLFMHHSQHFDWPLPTHTVKTALPCSYTSTPTGGRAAGGRRRSPSPASSSGERKGGGFSCSSEPTGTNTSAIEEEKLKTSELKAAGPKEDEPVSSEYRSRPGSCCFMLRLGGDVWFRRRVSRGVGHREEYDIFIMEVTLETNSNVSELETKCILIFRCGYGPLTVDLDNCQRGSAVG